MLEAAEKKDSRPERTAPQFEPGEMASLIGRMRAFLSNRAEKIQTSLAPYDGALLESRFGFTARSKGRADVILAEDMAVELGHPSTPSQAIVLTSYRPDLVHHGRISIVGPDVDEMGGNGRRPFGQVVMLAFRRGQPPDPFEVDSAQYLIRRLPGYMVRSVPGRLWARISLGAQRDGLTMKTVGSALIAAYTGDFEAVEKVEVAFVTSCGKDVEALAEIGHEASILAGKHKKLVLGADGEVECPDLDCESCDDKSVCDNLKDIVIKRRKRRES